MKKLIFYLLVFFLTEANAQPWQYIDFPPQPNPANLSVDSYSRATVAVRCFTGTAGAGFKYGFISDTAAKKLLNLNISSYPAYVNNNYQAPSSYANYYAPNPALEAAVTTGVHHVNEIGAFGYDVPLVCSPGTAGLEPRLSISYNSGGANGWMGLGFNLTGISSITRIGKSVFYDTLPGGVKFNSDDVFAMDGTRLLIKTGTYGQNNSTYKTPVENYNGTEFFDTGSGQQYFVVTTPDGMTMEYGRTADSRHRDVANTQTIGWYINKIYDPFGNYMTYSYTNSNGEILIDKIEYTGNSNNSLSPYNKMEFTWMDRSDDLSYYVAGKEFRRKKLLKSVRSKDMNGNTVRNYHLNYEYEYASLLSKITESDANGNQLNPTFFEWRKEVKPALVKTLGISPFSGGVTEYPNSVVADLNGDGKKDIVLIKNQNELKLKTQLLGQGGGNPSCTPPAPYNFGSANYKVVESISVELMGTFVMDEDDDNKEEVYIVYGNAYGGSFGYKICKLTYDTLTFNVSFEETGTVGLASALSWRTLAMFRNFSGSVNNSPWFYAKEDVDGDDLKDTIRVHGAGIKIKPGNGSAPVEITQSDMIKSALGDFDGDGVNDLYVLRAGAIDGAYLCEVRKHDPSNNTFPVVHTDTIYTATSPYMSSWYTYLPTQTERNYANAARSIDFGDFDGDGKMDIMHVEYISGYNVKVYVLKSTGVSFLNDYQPITIPLLLDAYESTFSAMDANTDGLCDLLVSSYDYNGKRTNFNHYPSNGNKLTDAFLWKRFEDEHLGALGDFNGDGMLDYISQKSMICLDVELNAFHQNNKKHVQRIFNIKDDLKITYGYLPGKKPPTETESYYVTDTLENTDPIFNGKTPQLFVARMVEYNDSRIKYGYRNSVNHQPGKGFLGFEKMISYDDNRTTSVSQFGTNGKAASIASFEYDPASGDMLSSESVNGFVPIIYMFNQVPALVSAWSKSAFTYVTTGTNRYLSSTISESKDYLSSVRNKITTTFDQNSGGLTLSTLAESLPWNSSAAINSVQEDYTYSTLANSLSTKNYFRGQKITKVATAGSNSSTFVTDLNYDGSGRLTSSVANSNLSDAVTTTYSQFNVFGTALKTEVTASDLAQSRFFTVTYDPTGRFITNTYDALNNVQQNTYEPTYGNVTESKDINGRATRFQYDGLGRLTITQGPTGAYAKKKREWYGTTVGPLTTYGLKTTVEPEAGGSVVTWHDRDGNVIKTETEGFGGNTEISENTFNVNGLLVSSKPAKYSAQTVYKYYDYTYDEYQRPVTVKEYRNIGTTLLNTVNYSYNTPSTDAAYNKGFSRVCAPSGSGSTQLCRLSENDAAGQLDKIINYAPSVQSHTATYSYNQMGLPVQVVTSFPGGVGGSTTSFAYDALGRRISLTDPSSGTSTFDYNSVGELLQSVTPQGQYDYTYDRLGRMTKRTGSGQGNFNYTYATSGNGNGQLSSVTGPLITTEFAYDTYGRQTEQKETGLSKVFKTKYSYDKYGRLVNYTYPNNFQISHHYDAVGNMIRIKTGNTAIWELTDMKAPGLVEGYQNSVGTGIAISYDNSLNLSQIDLGNLSSQEFIIASTSNMLQRKHSNIFSGANNNEGFKYDAFNRLTQTNYDVGVTTLNKHAYSYSPNGNLTYKEDCGNYDYGTPSKPYQLTQIQNPVGNTSLNTLNLTHNDIDKVSQITEGNNTFDFVYGNDGQRFKMNYSVSGVTNYNRYYQDRYDRQESGSGVVKDWCYIYSPTGLTAVYYTNNNTPELLDVTCDHLGSPILITNSSGGIEEEYSFDAWGRRRKPADWNDYTVSAPGKMIRGYTGHEHLDEVGLINMNGRMYDPVLGRFVQPDPIVQDPGNLQNMNRYSYVLNNPVNFNDPSGYRTVKPQGGGTTPDGTVMNRASTNPMPLIVVDGMVVSGAEASMYMNGGGGIGIASSHNYGVWTGNGPGLRNSTMTFGGLMDRGKLFNSYTDYVTVSGKAYAKAYPEVAELALANNMNLEMISGAVEVERTMIDQGAVDEAQSGGHNRFKDPDFIEKMKAIGFYDENGQVASKVYGGEGPIPSFSALKIKDLYKAAKVLRNLVRKGQAPKSITRVDIPKMSQGEPIFGQKPHVHLEDGRAFNLDGTWKHGEGDLSNRIINWLSEILK